MSDFALDGGGKPLDTDLLGLTLYRPWSDVVASGEKLIENRSWAPPRSAIGRVIAVHAGKVYDQEGAEFIRTRGVEPLPPERSRLGIVGLVRLVGVVRESSSPWFFGPFGWVLEHVRELAEAVPCKGAMGLWRVPEDVARRVLETSPRREPSRPRPAASAVQAVTLKPGVHDALPIGGSLTRDRALVINFVDWTRRGADDHR